MLEKALYSQEASERGAASRAVIELVQAAYKENHLPRHAGKGFLTESRAEVWGSQLDGEEGWVRPNWNSVSLLEILAGSWISALSYRRRLLCLLAVIYSVVRGLDRTSLLRPSVALILLKLFPSECAISLLKLSGEARPSLLVV